MLAALVFLPLPAVLLAQPVGGRLRPPADLACGRDHLTAFTGVVADGARSLGRTVLTLVTDEGPVETVTLRHPGTDDPSAWFLIGRRAFRPEDWPRLEIRPGVLREGLRVTAWVCDDGSNAVIDWETPRAP